MMVSANLKGHASRHISVGDISLSYLLSMYLLTSVVLWGVRRWHPVSVFVPSKGWVGVMDGTGPEVEIFPSVLL